jgi:hypothetical protein
MLQRTMPTMDPAMTKVKKMNKIGVKRTKRNDSVYKEKLKKKKLEKKLENEDSDYEPNLFEAEDSDEEVDVSNHKPPLFRKTIGCVMLAILLLMKWKTSHLLTKVLQSPTSIQMIITRILFLCPPFHLLQ